MSAQMPTARERGGTQPQRVGFVGVGQIGRPMAVTLVEAGFDVTVHDLREEAVQACVESGAAAAGSLRELAGRDVIGVAVLDDAQVSEVVTGDGGLLEHARPGAVVVVHSTILPETARRLAGQGAERGVAVLDAPVSGGDMAARAGTLSIMLGGDGDAIARCRPVLEALGSNIFHLGGPGAGAAGKLANQLMTFVNQLAALEAMQLATSYGLSEEQVVELARAGTADSWVIRQWGFFDRILADYERSGTPPMYRPWAKDLWDVVVVSRQQGLSLPLAGLSAQLSTLAFGQRADTVR